MLLLIAASVKDPPNRRKHSSKAHLNCFHCQTPIPDASRFCHSCGGLVSDPTGGGVATAEMDEASSRELAALVRQELGSEFQLVRELGRGGMAVVYLATEVHLGRQIAIKVLPPELTFGKGAIERFRREARTAATLDHPNIIPIYRVTPGGKLFWYAMKYLEGRSLDSLLEERKRLSLAETIHILEPIAAALDYAHRRKVVHRDIKPANVMIDLDDRAVLTDFGIAKALTAGSLTASGSVLGTPFYMSPEQWTGGELNGAADQYSVGIMSYQMLSGQVPFHSKSIPELLHKHCNEPPPPLEILRPGLPNHVYGAINRALAKEPVERFASVGAFVQGLKRPSPEAATSDAPGRDAQPRDAKTRTVAPRERRPRPFATKAVTVTVLIGAAAGGLWVLSRPPEASGPSSARRDGVDTARTPAEPTALAARPTTGQVVVTGLPVGGTISIDDRARTGTTFDMEAGPHVLRMQANGFESVDTVFVRAGESVVRPFVVPPRTPPTPVASLPATQGPPRPAGVGPQTAVQPSVLVIQTAGGWARISVDGAFRLEGTSHRDTLSPGAHRVRLERSGYTDVDTAVVTRSGETHVVRLAMTRNAPSPGASGGSTGAPAPTTGSYGVLVTQTTGGWARISIDGVFRAEGTSHRDTLAPGPHHVRLTRDGYVAADTTVTVGSGETTVLRMIMRRSS